MDDLSKIRWQCRRGMRELDILLERYVQTEYGQSTEPEKAAFRELLTLSDPELAAYLLRSEAHSDQRSRAVIGRILGVPGA